MMDSLGDKHISTHIHNNFFHGTDPGVHDGAQLFL